MYIKRMLLACGISLASCSIQAQDLQLSSASIAPDSTLPNAQVFNGFGCTGDNLSPALSWTSGPEGTKSYALTVYDPDAPTGSGWWHWVVYNIPAGVSELAAGAGSVGGELMPNGAVQGPSDYGYQGFGGACPPAGDKPHRYVFTVYALKTEKIELPEGASAAMVGYMINANLLEKASFTATYGR